MVTACQPLGNIERAKVQLSQVWSNTKSWNKELADARQKFRQQKTTATAQRRKLDWKLAVADAVRSYTIVLKDGVRIERVAGRRQPRVRFDSTETRPA